MLQDSEALVLVGGAYAVVLLIALQTGVVGVVGGSIRRADCPSGFWIIAATLSLSCLTSVALAAFS
jgi:hypothetical protein